MSSKRKDARWAYALTHVEDLGLVNEDFSFQGFQKFLDRAEVCFNENPGSEDFWYQSWLNRQGAENEQSG